MGERSSINKRLGLQDVSAETADPLHFIVLKLADVFPRSVDLDLVDACRVNFLTYILTLMAAWYGWDG